MPEPKTGKNGILSGQEEEVLVFLARGAGNKEVAPRLHISERTVKGHITGIFNKPGVNSRAEAVAVAMRTGLQSPES